jgi:hypothetical protein
MSTSTAAAAFPGFSGVDLESGNQFVPGFFQSCPKMPHGLLVPSDNGATGPSLARTRQIFHVDRPLHSHRSTNRRAMEREI